MELGSEDEEHTCDLCGRPIDVDGADLTIELELFTAGGGTLEAGFCRQEHAAQWLSRPLPPPVMPDLLASERFDRVVPVVIVVLVVWTLVTALIGSVTLVGWLRHW